VGGYATRNLTAGAKAISNDARINANMTTGTKVPGQYIPVNQGFFISTALDGFNDNNGTPIATVDGGTIVLKNNQRVYVPEGVESTFFKSSDVKNAKPSNKGGKPTIKLMYDSPLGYHRQVVLGANINASEGFDMGYDALMIDVNTEDLYWMLNENKFVIQGIDGFNDSQEFPLGLKVKKAGLAKIRMESLENIEGDMNLYIKDKLTNETHDITNAPFEMYLDAGTYNNRFALVFSSSEASALSVEENDLLNEITMYYDSEQSSLKVKASTTGSNILGIQVYNLIGQKIKSVTTNLKDITVPVSVSSTGVYIVKCHTEKGMFNKKTVIN
tara:strand:- start:22122 stop:23108 length:987 start_codon:yes stop_codon:yes gene_type:complete